MNGGKTERKKSPEKELNKIDTSNLSDIKFKRMVIRMHKKLNANYKKLSENTVKKDIETIIKKPVRVKNTVSKMKNAPEGINLGQMKH